MKKSIERNPQESNETDRIPDGKDLDDKAYERLSRTSFSIYSDRDLEEFASRPDSVPGAGYEVERRKKAAKDSEKERYETLRGDVAHETPEGLEKTIKEMKARLESEVKRYEFIIRAYSDELKSKGD